MEVNLMTEKEVSDLLQKRRTALYNLRKKTRIPGTSTYSSGAI